MGRWRELAVAGWSTFLALLLLGPALAPGYVLTYDMVWVPDLALDPDAMGTGTALPRAVPSDAVVAVLDELFGGMLLQKLVLLGALVPGALGAARLVGRGSLVGGLVAATLWTWNPFVVERLFLGHWPVLVGYATLPWVLLAADRWRRTRRLPPALLLLLPVGSLSASAGLVTGAALLAGVSSRRSGRWVAALGLVLAANAPWIVSGMLHAGAATPSSSGFAVFGPGDEGAQVAPVAALTFGGIWNADVVPSSRTGLQGWGFLLLLLVLVVLGARDSWRHRAAPGQRRFLAGLIVCWLLGYGLVVLTWAAPETLDEVAAVLPGLALLRDGSRLLGLCVPLVVVLAGRGAADATRAACLRLPAAATPWAAGVCLVLWPLALLPDAAWGGAGRLDAVAYPEELLGLAPRVSAAGAEGATLVLPLTSYRAPEWNDRRPVLDPLPRLLPGDVVSSDTLVVSGVPVRGEDPRVLLAEQALDAGEPDARSRRLAAAGVGLVVVDPSAPGDAPRLEGRPVGVTAGEDPGGPLVLRLSEPDARPRPTGWGLAMAGAWAAFIAMPCAALAARMRRRAQESRSVVPE